MTIDRYLHTCRSNDLKIFKPSSLLLIGMSVRCADTVRHLVGKQPEVSGDADQSGQRHVPELEKTCLLMVNGDNLR